MKILHRIFLLIIITITLSTVANLLLAQYQSKKLHDDSEKILVQVLAHSLREAVVQDVIDNNKLRVTNLLLNLKRNNSPIEFLYVTDVNYKIFAHSFEQGFPRYLVRGEEERHSSEPGVHLMHKYQTESGLVYEYSQVLIRGLDTTLHIGVNQTQIDDVIIKNNQSLVVISVCVGLIALFVAYLWGRKITRPLNMFADNLERFRSGNKVNFKKIDKGDPDIRGLAESFETVIAEREQALSIVQQRERDLDVTLNSIGDAVITTDTKGVVTRMNPVAEKLTGWSYEEAKGQSIEKIFVVFDESTRQTVINPIDAILHTGKPVFLGNHAILKARDGTEYHIADSAAPIRAGTEGMLGMVLVFNDVSEQYKLREAANESRRNLQAIMDNSPAVIYAKNIDGRYIFINKQWEDLFVKDKEGVIGKTDYEIFPKEFADGFTKNDSAVLSSGRELKVEEIAPHEDGLHTYVTVKFPLFDDDNKPYALCGISTDITEQKIQAEQLKRSQKMDALGKLTGGIAHDYNNMLGVILGYSELLANKLAGEPALTKYTEQIHHAAERGSDLTKRLLAFTRHKSTQTEVLDINVLLQYQKDMLQKLLTPRVEMIYKLVDKVWPICVDEHELEDAIINLSINAMHAMDGEGRLTFQTQNISLNEMEAKFQHLPTGDYVLLSLGDTGSGMDDVTKEKMFDPFYTTKGEKGSGLGLSQVYGFVQRSNGAINVYSELGSGTRLNLYFPRESQSYSQKSSEAVKHDVDLTGSEVILVVDDEPSLVSLCSEILGQQGYRVIGVNSAKQALETLEKESVDLLVSDVIMPGMTGYELAGIVQKKYPAIKIQLASGFNDQSPENHLDNVLRSNMLYKPYNSTALLKRVRELLG